MKVPLINKILFAVCFLGALIYGYFKVEQNPRHPWVYPFVVLLITLGFFLSWVIGTYINKKIKEWIKK